MKKRIIIAIIIILFTTGCWNYRELNDMAIVGLLGIDYNDEKNEYEVMVQILNAKKSAAGSSDTSGDNSGSPITLYRISSTTIHEALRNILYYSPKKLYIGHLKSIIINEKLAKNDVLLIGDFLFRDPESRKDFNIIVAKDSNAYDIMSLLTPIESLPDSSILDKILSNTKYKGSAVSISYDEFLSKVYATGDEPVMPAITMEGDPKRGSSSEESSTSLPTASTIIKNLAVFKNEKLIGYLSEDESVGYSIINNELGGTVISFKCDKEKYGSIEIISSASKIKVNTEGEMPKVNVNIEIDAILSEFNCKSDLKNLKNVDKVSDTASKKVKSIVQSEIDATKKFNSDINGIGNIIYINNPKYWKHTQKKWYDMFEYLEYNVDIKMNMTHKGSITTSIFEEEK